MIDPFHVDSLLKFLGIERKHWQVAVEQTALASVRAFHILHNVHLRGPLERVQSDRDSSSISRESDEDTTISVNKRKPQSISENPTLVDSDLDSLEPVRPLEEAQQLQSPRRTPSTSPVTVVAEFETLAPGLPTGGTLHPVCSTPATRRWALGNGVKPRTHVRHSAQKPLASDGRTLEMRFGSCGSSGKHRPKRKRWSTSISTNALGSDYLDSQPAKRSRHDTDRQEAMLWTRLRQLDPRRKRSS
jgi:hypothetical protein